VKCILHADYDVIIIIIIVINNHFLCAHRKKNARALSTVKAKVKAKNNTKMEKQKKIDEVKYDN